MALSLYSQAYYKKRDFFNVFREGVPVAGAGQDHGIIR
jgi:hypothetical protein